MDLSDCPPGAEGYEDTVIEKPKKPETEETSQCTKAEKEFQDHLSSLKIRLENGETRCMVERRGRDISGKWIYLCFPCGSVCSGESILQTHISGKKHKIKLSMRNTWPLSVFDDHRFNHSQKESTNTATDKVLKKMAEAVEIHKTPLSELESKYSKYQKGICHIQETLDALKTPLLGLEYLVEHPPEKEHHEPSYLCTLCTKQGHPRTIINHITCYYHQHNYLSRHFPAAFQRLESYKNVPMYRVGVHCIINRLAQRINDKYGRLKPLNIDKDDFEKDKDAINKWIFNSFHYSEKLGPTFEEVVDIDLIKSLAKTETGEGPKKIVAKKRDPSPPIVAAPSKPHYARAAGRKMRKLSMESLSDISDDDKMDRPDHNRKQYVAPETFRSRMRISTPPEEKEKYNHRPRPVNHEYKTKLLEEKITAATEASSSMLAYHEKNPEKHPLYPEEWKKFWNRRYKEIQAEGKDPSQHDFKPEWIVFWTKRMKELHNEELQRQITEIHRRLNIPPPERLDKPDLVMEKKHVELRRKSPEFRKRSPEPRRRSPIWSSSRRRSPEVRGRDGRRRSIDRKRSPDMRRHSPDLRHRSPARQPDLRHGRRVIPDSRYSIDRRRQPPLEVRRSPPPRKRTRSRSPVPSRRRSPSRTSAPLEARRSRSPLSRREGDLRNRSPQARRLPSPAPPVQLHTVMISDDELKTDDISPWNSDNDIDSVISAPRSVAGSLVSSQKSLSRRAASRAAIEHQDLGPAENIVATLRVLVALEDYLGSLGPKIVDLLTEALKMEKERANSSEDLLERDSAMVLVETAKEKLKGAAQAGLVPPAAAPALRAAVLRAAATLHAADTRHKKLVEKPESVPVAGVGEVDRAQIAQQMAAALIAQGKTDVTSEELAQLVDAVVGMAEAKKRETESNKKESKLAPSLRARESASVAKLSGTATALQMLQSAYDENDKKTDKEDAMDAMDGLSDSDLETLLKNFNELSAEEQHSLIAYLKKLEAREPARVERLRQYVSAAATYVPPSSEPAPPPSSEAAPPPKINIKTVTVESDDDDYTVEEVFQSATQKVKEDQIKKEMDIVKKSLESKTTDNEQSPIPVKTIPRIDLSMHNISSASNLFALVQASIKSTSSVAPVANAQAIGVVTSASQPRSFGDKAESLEPAPLPISEDRFDTQDASIPIPDNQNYHNEDFDQDQQWNQRQMNNMSNNRGIPTRDLEYNNDDVRFSQYNDSVNSQVSQGPNSGPNRFGQGPNTNQNQFGQGPNSGQSQFGPGPNSSQFGQGSNVGQGQFGQEFNSSQDQFDPGSNFGSNNFDQGPSSNSSQFGHAPNSGPNQFGQGPNTGSNQYGQGPNVGHHQFDQRANSGPAGFNQGGSNQAPNHGGNNNWHGNNAQNENRQGPNHKPNQYQGNRGNFHGRKDNFDNRQQPPQFGNFDNQNKNFRGRGGGRGNYGGGPMRGRGRGRY